MFLTIFLIWWEGRGGRGRSLLNAIVGKNFKKKTQSDLSQLSMEEYSKSIFKKKINKN